jgi:ABC-type uncharacterized transport system permease subunit
MEFLALTLAGIVSTGAPLVLATLGETLTERGGVINLALDGSILLSAMAAVAVSLLSGNPWLGLGASALVGILTAALVAVLGPVLGRSQVAVGFILTLLCRDLAYFLGHPFARKLGPELPVWSLPGFDSLPFVGTVFGRHSPVVYLSLLLIPFLWYWIFLTRPGLELRAVGEKPQAAFARGLSVQYLRIVYTLVGGALVGLAGGACSLAVKPGWGRPQGAPRERGGSPSPSSFSAAGIRSGPPSGRTFSPPCKCSASRSRRAFPGCPHLSSRYHRFP